MNNSLLTKISNYGLTLMSNQIKDKITKYALIGSTSFEDLELIAALEDNDVNNNLDYGTLYNKNWIGYEGVVKNKYYDSNNFLSIDISIPIEENLNIYVYGFALLEVSENVKKIISITRSPSIFNKVKNTSSTFSIKMTFGQEDINSQYRDDIYDSRFIINDFLFIGNMTANSNIVESTEKLSNISIGTVLQCDELSENIVVVDNSITNSSIKENQLILSKMPKKDLTNKAFFKKSSTFNFDNYVSLDEFNKWQKEHNHNNLYYLIGETVNNSNKLSGKPSNFYLNIENLEKINKSINNKLDLNGGTMLGSLYTNISKTDFKNNEYIPMYQLNKNITEIKDYINNEFYINIKDYINSFIGNISNLETFNRTNIISSINELKLYSGNYKLLNGNITENILNILNQIENLNFKMDKKIDKNDNIFDSQPYSSSITPIENLSENQLITLSNANQLLSAIRRMIEIDISSESTNMSFPLILNENGLRSYTNSIITNEKNLAINSNMRLLVNGCGSSNNLSCSFLSVSNSCFGNNKFVKKISIFESSSCVVIWLRGGSKYFIELSGTDINPIIGTSRYNLNNTNISVVPEVWTDSESLALGSWEYNNINQIDLDYSINPHIFNN